MAAITSLLWSLLRPGDVIVTTPSLYDGSEYFIRHLVSEFDLKQSVIEDPLSAESTARTLLDAREEAQKRHGRLGLIYTEMPSNPLGHMVDLKMLRACVDVIFQNQDGHKPLIAVDNTLAGPIFSKPLRHGTDISLLSMTRYVGGHSDLLGGCISFGEQALGKILLSTRTMLGSHLDPV